MCIGVEYTGCNAVYEWTSRFKVLFEMNQCHGYDNACGWT